MTQSELTWNLSKAWAKAAPLLLSRQVHSVARATTIKNRRPMSVTRLGRVPPTAVASIHKKGRGREAPSPGEMRVSRAAYGTVTVAASLALDVVIEKVPVVEAV